MLERVKTKIEIFINNNKDTPFLAALICGLTPLFFYYSNNYWAANSWAHILYFSLCFVGSSFALFTFAFFGLRANKKLSKYVSSAILLLVLCVIFGFLSHTFFFSPKKRIVLLFAIIFIGFLSWKNPCKNYKKLIIFLLAFSSLSFVRTLIHIYEDVKPEYWLQQNDNIVDAKFKSNPNVYVIQPDGYVSQSILEKSPYNFKSDLYDWLKLNEFKVYDDFRSNYPASLTSNASLFAMKHHKFANMVLPEIEMSNAREVITVKNPVVSIFKNNNYVTYFIAQDEYFQQNRKQEIFDYYNIGLDDFPFYSKGDDEVRDVFSDLKVAMTHQNKSPKFLFIEKLLPHHVGFHNTDESIIEETDIYNRRIEKVNLWLKKSIDYISKHDKNSIIIILADHGGWVGLKSYSHLFSATESELINSTFSNIAAIKWNGHLEIGYDKHLKTNVNLFRVLFSILSKEPKYLDHLEDDSSYNLKLNSFGLKKVAKMIDTNGQILN